MKIRVSRVHLRLDDGQRLILTRWQFTWRQWLDRMNVILRNGCFYGVAGLLAEPGRRLEIRVEVARA